MSSNDSDQESVSLSEEENSDLDEEEEVENEEEETGEGEEEDDDEETISEDIEELRNQLENFPSFKTCKLVMNLLKVTIAEATDGKQLSIVDGPRFNEIMSLCLVKLLPALTRVLKLPSHGDTHSIDPSKSRLWKQIFSSIRTYLINMMKITSNLNEPETLELVLKHLMQLIPYYVQFVKISKHLIKLMIHLWSTQQERIRILAFVVLHRITKRLSEEYPSAILKQMYLAYVRNAKFNTPTTSPLIGFMKKSLTEMYTSYSNVAYEHAFLYLRQLCIHLRNAVTTKKKESFQTVYNWQFVHCLLLWSDVVSALYDYEPIKTLSYPLVQLITGVITLLPTLKYVPLRFHLAKALTGISASTKLFIPVAPLVLEALTLIDTEKKVAFSKKPINLAYALKASKSQLQESGFRDAIVSEACKLLMEYFVVYSTSISYPELSFLSIHQLKLFLKKNKVSKYGQQVKFVVEKLQQRSNYISEQRKNVAFEITDVTRVKAWESTLTQQQATVALPHQPVQEVEEEFQSQRRKKRKFR